MFFDYPCTKTKIELKISHLIFIIIGWVVEKPAEEMKNDAIFNNSFHPKNFQDKHNKNIKFCDNRQKIFKTRN